MKNYKLYIKEVAKDIIELLDKNQLVCVTGRNMSGKSDILKIVIENNLEKNFYFIDTVNRSLFYQEAIMAYFSIIDNIGTTNDILKKRIHAKYFNKIDTFGISDEGFSTAHHAYLLLVHYYNEIEEKLSIFLSEFKIKMKYDSKSRIIKFMIRNEEVDLSSGYQALLRIFIEVYYSSKFGVNVIVIDEIDEHLDNNMCRIIIKKLKQLFPGIKFVTTVHSLTFFEELESSKIIVLDGENLSKKILDSRDLGNLEYVNREVFNSYSDFVKRKTKMEELYMKVYNDIPLTSQEKKYIKTAIDLSPEEKEIKAILMEELDV